MSEYYIGTENDESLQHYGVLGMKWGIRRYQNKDGSLTEAGKKHYAKTGESGYHYKSWGTKHNEKKAAKVARKISTTTDENRKKKLEELKRRYERRAKRSSELDKREQEYAERVGVGGNIVARNLVGVGNKPYQQYLAMMNGQNAKGITPAKFGAAFAGNLGGRLGSTAVKAMYLRSGENEKQRAKDIDRMIDKYIKLQNKEDDAIISRDKALASKYKKKKEALEIKIDDETDKFEKDFKKKYR